MWRDSAYDDDTDETMAWYNAPEAAAEVHHHYNHSDHSPPSLPHHRRRQHHHYATTTAASYSVVNHTVTTSVSIRVTPLQNYYWSWGILWGCFVVVTCIAAGQVLYEYLLLRQRWRRRRRPAAVKDSTATGSTTTAAATAAAAGYAVVTAVEDDTRPSTTEAESISTADLTRSMVRKYFRLQRARTRARTLILCKMTFWFSA
jgi:hypothetical protein